MLNDAIKRHPVLCGIVVLLLLVFFLITSLFSSFSNIGTGGLGSLAASTYLADDADINNAELIYTEWETDLQMQVNRWSASMRETTRFSSGVEVSVTFKMCHS